MESEKERACGSGELGGIGGSGEGGEGVEEGAEELAGIGEGHPFVVLLGACNHVNVTGKMREMASTYCSKGEATQGWWWVGWF